MDTDKFLRTLDESQLVYAYNKAGELIRAKRAEKQLWIWQVTDGGVVFGSYPENQYLEAVESLAEKAKELDKENADNDEKLLQIDFVRVPESEYGQYVRR